MTQLYLDLEEGRGRPAPPPPADRAGAGILVRELERIARDGGRARKVLIARTRGEGKELLRQVALRGQSWVGFEINTLRALATKIVARELARTGRTIVDTFDEHALMERAIDEVIASPRFSRFGELAEKTGFRDAVRKSASTLRGGGIHPPGDPPAGAHRGFNKRALVTQVLARYETLLRDGGRTDMAGMLKRAIAVLGRDEHDALPPDTRFFLLPGLAERGLEGRFLAGLRRLGAVLLKTDPVVGLKVPKGILWDVAPPEAPGSYLHAVDRCGAEIPPERVPERIELFTAASVQDELRGVLRRALEMGARWDEVEIVAADPWAYGSALHALAEPMGVPVTFAVGLPVERTRPGRVVSTYFRWIASGFQESLFRALVEAGDVIPPRPGAGERAGQRLGGRRSGTGSEDRPRPGGPRLARALRRLRIGWGRERHLDKIEHALRTLDSLPAGRFDDEERLQRRKERRGEELRALRGLLRPVLRATPPTDGRVSPSQVAAGVKSLLARVAPGTDTDETARQRLLRQLERIEATVKRPTDFASAAAIVQSYLEIRIPAPRMEGIAPWSSAPGHLYMTDLRHGGATGRRVTFIVGLDSGSVLGSLHEDPLIGDQERFRIGGGELPLAADRVVEARFNFARLFARLRGTVVLSYACWDPGDSRELTPAPELLQALRLRQRDSTLTFEDLDGHLGLTESRLPRPGIAVDLDASDVWLRALTTDSGRLRDGLAAVGRSFPRLGMGQALLDALDRDEPTVHAGFLGTHSPPLSYENWSDRPFSASGLETLGACPRRFLFSYILKARPPDDPEFDPDRWLNALERGSLLHAVYEETLKEAAARGVNPAEERFLDIALRLVDRKGAEQLLKTPSPSDALHAWEMDALRDDARSFVEMIRDRSPRWAQLEWRFGMDDEMRIGAGDGSVMVRGVVDRVDDLGAHLRVVDYKTGGGYGYSGRSQVYNGGRRLQHFVYTAAVAALYGRPVDAMEYHFPTRRGENRVRRYGTGKLKHGGELVEVLLKALERGWFPATDSAKDDCRYCDYREVCGAEASDRGQVSCGVAEWTKRNLDSLDELSLLRQVRKWDDEGPVL